MRARGRVIDEHHVHVAAEQALNRRAGAAVRHLVEVDPGRLLEQHGGEMKRIAHAGVGNVDLAGLALSLLDQLGHGVYFELCRIGDQHGQEASGERHRREILGRIEGQLLVEAGIGRICRDVAKQHGIAVGRRLGDEIGAEIGRRAGLVLDHDRLAGKFGHLLPDEPREEISPAARGIRNDQMNRPGWIGLCGGILDHGHRAEREDRSQYRHSK